MREPSLINAKMQPDGTVVRIPPATDWQVIADELAVALAYSATSGRAGNADEALAAYYAAKETQP